MYKADPLPPENEPISDWETYAETLGDLSPAHLALEALSWHDASDLPSPQWAVDEIVTGYNFFKLGAPDAGFTHEQRNLKSSGSLGQALGVPDLPKGTHLRKKREFAAKASKVMNHFYGPDRLSQTEENFERVGAVVNLTPSQIRDVVRMYKPK